MTSQSSTTLSRQKPDDVLDTPLPCHLRALARTSKTDATSARPPSPASSLPTDPATPATSSPIRSPPGIPGDVSFQNTNLLHHQPPADVAWCHIDLPFPLLTSHLEFFYRLNEQNFLAPGGFVHAAPLSGMLICSLSTPPLPSTSKFLLSL